MGVYGFDCPAIFETWSAHIFGGWQRVCWCTNEASKNFEKTALRKRVGILTVKMRGGHIYGNYCTLSTESLDYLYNRLTSCALNVLAP